MRSREAVRRATWIAMGTLGLSFSSATAAPAQGASPGCRGTENVRRVERQLQALLDSVLQAYPDVPGIALTVLAPGRCLAWSGAVGVVDRDTRVALTTQHPYRIASNTKTYTAAAILRLVEAGRLSLDDPISRHLPDADLSSLRRDGYAVDRITVHHLLTHTAGLYDYAMDERFVAAVARRPSHRWTRAEQVDSAVTWGAPYGQPGERFHYSDTGYILLGQIIERLSGQGLAAALRALLRYDALGLSSTWLETLEPAPAAVPDLAHQYMPDGDTRGFDPSFDLYGGGGLAATTADMARFTRALFTGGVFTQPGTLATMTTVPAGSTGPRVYALGVGRQDLQGEVGWGHSGFWNTFSYHFPARDVTIAASITMQGRRDVARTILLGSLGLIPR